MADVDKTKVFISWSGDTSKAVALALRDWLPDLFDTVLPWASDIDIAAGQKGLPQIEQTLQGSQFGIIVVTQENQNAPWLNFEAGALSKVITTDTEQRVAPLLVDLTSPTQLTGPMSQFQANVLDKVGLTKVLQSLGEVVGVAPDVVTRRVNLSWPQLEEEVKAAKSSIPRRRVAKRSLEDMVEEVLTTVRELRREPSETQRMVNAALGSGTHPKAVALKLRKQQHAEREEEFTRIAQELAVDRGLPFRGIGRDKTDPRQIITSIHFETPNLTNEMREYLVELNDRYPDKVLRINLFQTNEDGTVTQL